MSLPRIINGPRPWSAVAVGRDQLAMAGPVDCRTYSRPAGLLADLGGFLTMAVQTMGHPAESTVAVSAVPEQDRDQLAAAAGWQNRSAVASAWSTYVHEVTGETVHMVDLDQLAAADPSAWPNGLDPAALAVKLAAYNHATGTAYRVTPGVAGCAMIRRQAAEAAARRTAAGRRTAGQPYWRYDGHPAFLTPMGDLRWTAPTLPTSGVVHQYDARAAYLAAASAAMLAWSPLVHTGAVPFDPDHAGYWQVNAADVPDMHGGRPLLVDPARVGSDGTVWLTTPVMGYLLGRGVNPDVIDSWTCEHTGRYLRPWAEAIRDGLAAADDPDVSTLLKETYRQTIGMFNRPGGSVYRPDWWATIVDLARVNLLRKVDKAAAATGRYPARIYVDAVYYAADTGAEAAALAAALDVDPDGRRIGKLRSVTGMPAAAFAEKLTPPARRRRVPARSIGGAR